MGNSARMLEGAPHALALVTAFVLAGAAPREAHAQEAPAPVARQALHFESLAESYDVVAVPEESHECQAPCTLQLPPGRWRVEARWSDGRTALNEVEIARGEVTRRGYRAPATLTSPRAPSRESLFAGSVLAGVAVASAAYSLAALITSYALDACGSTECRDVSVGLTVSSAVVGLVLAPSIGAGAIYALVRVPPLDAERPPPPRAAVTAIASPGGAHVGVALRF